MPTDLSFAKRVVIVIALVALALLAWRLREVLLLVFGSVLVAALLRALATPVARRIPVLSEGWAVAIVALLLAGLLALGAWQFGREVQQQASELVQRMPEAWDALQQRISATVTGERVLQRVKEDFSGANVMAGVSNAFLALLGGLGHLLLVVFGGLYLAAQPGLYRRGLVELMPTASRPRVDLALGDAGVALRRWLVGRLVAMVLVGALIGLGLWALGMPSALALGLLAGLLEFIPFIGPIVAAIPALLLASGEGTDTLLWVLGLYVVIQQLEGNVITPLLQHQVVALPPAVTLFAVIAFALVFGPLGLLLGVPLSVVAFVFVKRLWLHQDPAADPSASG